MMKSAENYYSIIRNKNALFENSRIMLADRKCQKYDVINVDLLIIKKTVMWYYCVLEESDRFFQTSPPYNNDSKQVREKVFQNKAQPSSEKSFWISKVLKF